MLAEAMRQLAPDLTNPNWGSGYWPWVVVALSAAVFAWLMWVAVRKPPK